MVVVRLLLEALERNPNPEARFVALATVEAACGAGGGGSGAPHVRTVVVRKVLGLPSDTGATAASATPATTSSSVGGPLRVLFTTHAASAKVHQTPLAEMCWYFQGTREQFRLSGNLSFQGEGGLVVSKANVSSSSSPAALYTAAPHAQHDGMFSELRKELWLRASADTRTQFVDVGQEQHRDKDRPPSCFLLGILEAHSVDHLTLTKPNVRRLYKWKPATTGSATTGSAAAAAAAAAGGTGEEDGSWDDGVALTA